jgi:uncharacterized surface protein with fasciclin (FAS1) repeats
MRRLWLSVFSFLILTTNFLPVLAQGESITQIIDNRADLSTLSAFLDAAPTVREQLEDGNSYTLFAPNDRAFANLINTLDVSLVDLLGDPDIASAILQYHIIDGSFSSDEISQRSGQVVPTLLAGAFVSFRVNDDDTLAVNNVVEIIESDINASNGTIQIINDVLLNRVIDDLVDSISLETLITPNPTSPSDTSTQEATPEATVAAIEIANMRFAHFATDVPAVDIYIGDNLVYGDTAFGEITDFSSLEAGRYSLTIRGRDSDEKRIVSLNLNLSDGDFKTIVLFGSLENDSLRIKIIEEDYSELESDSRLLVFQAIEDTPEIDISLGDDIQVEGLRFGDRETLDISADSYDLLIYAHDEHIFDQAGLEFAEDNYYLFAVIGNRDDATIAIASLGSETIEDLRQGTMLTRVEEVEETETPEPPSDETVLDILKADDRFSTFVEALDAADEDLINRLASRNVGSVTVLAPTNQAFENLFATFVSRRQFLANTDLLTQILQYHLIDGEMIASDFRAATGTSIITLLQPTQAFFVTVDSEGEVFLNRNIQFEELDIQASNGVIHVIDDLLLPQVALDTWN